jgi:arginase
MAPRDLSLLVPEWQGSGRESAVGAGTRALAALFPRAVFATIDAPDQETLATDEGVIGVGSIAARTRETLAAIDQAQPARIFTIAGTCGAELAPVTYLSDRYKSDFAVVWLDAHGDLNTPQSSPSAHFHGMVLRTLMGDGAPSLASLVRRPLAATQIVLAGVRSLDRDEATFISDAAISRLGPADLLVPDRVTGRLRSGGFTKIYVHVDLDVLDPVEFPDVLVPAAGGISAVVLTETIRSLASAFDIVGVSVVEFRPLSAHAPARVRRLLDGFGLELGALS